jgi:hypothetical protein
MTGDKYLDFSIVREDGLYLQNWVVKLISVKHGTAYLLLDHYRTMWRDASYLKWQMDKRYNVKNDHGRNNITAALIPMPRALSEHIAEKLQMNVHIEKMRN